MILGGINMRREREELEKLIVLIHHGATLVSAAAAMGVLIRGTGSRMKDLAAGLFMLFQIGALFKILDEACGKCRETAEARIRKLRLGLKERCRSLIGADLLLLLFLFLSLLFKLGVPLALGRVRP